MKTFFNIAVLALAIGALWSCSPKVEEPNRLNFSIDGSFAGMAGDTAFLKLITENGNEFVDSARVDAGGSFHLESPISKPDFYILHFSNSDRQITIVPDTCQRISISCASPAFENEYSVSGSPESELICSLIHKIADTRSICDSLGKIFRANVNAPNLAGIKERLDSIYSVAQKSQRQFSERFLKDNPNALSQIVCLSQYIAPRNPVFDPEKDFSIYKDVADNLSQLYPENYHARKLVAYVDKLRLAQAGQTTLYSHVKSGDKAPDIALPTQRGDTVRLSSLKGRYILLDFWASWSDVSRKNSENLNKLYWKFYHNKLSVYQVSLDDSRESWTQGIREQRLSWISVSDLKGWNSKAVEAYGVRQLPATYLIYPDFTVHEINLQADKLDARLLELLGKPIVITKDTTNK